MRPYSARFHRLVESPRRIASRFARATAHAHKPVTPQVSVASQQGTAIHQIERSLAYRRIRDSIQTARYASCSVALIEDRTLAPGSVSHLTQDPDTNHRYRHARSNVRSSQSPCLPPAQEPPPMPVSRLCCQVLLASECRPGRSVCSASIHAQAPRETSIVSGRISADAITSAAQPRQSPAALQPLPSPRQKGLPRHNQAIISQIHLPLREARLIFPNRSMTRAPQQAPRRWCRNKLERPSKTWPPASAPPRRVPVARHTPQGKHLASPDIPVPHNHNNH